ncbi:hypothetical protein [Robiginitomaculum antarcticum]|uniref:hypothetical protein n=1 Tax=Robiginitomaculum antarcticum TaxID=437507 RepID=UPI00036E9967|nr:hypothetical protein [Robiginitomaculum antarcticum]
MSPVPAIIPSLARAFEAEREGLRAELSESDLGAAQTVRLARRALDRTGAQFAESTADPAVQKAGLWLLEMVKTGAGVLDTGARADVVWREAPPRQPIKIAGGTLFYGAALFFAGVGLVQDIPLLMWASGILAALRAFDPSHFKGLGRFLTFWRAKPMALDGPDGRRHLAEARVSVDSAGFVDSLADALRTADHILMRLSEPMPDTQWYDNSRVTGLMQSLLEAHGAGDGDFALRVIETELNSVLASEGIRAVNYNSKDKRLFDVLPALDTDMDSPQGAPALVVDERVLKRGTVWKSQS